MNELTFDNQLVRLYTKFSFLWKEYGFKVSYLTSSYDRYFHGFILGLENDLCKLVFEKDPDPREYLIRDYIGKKSSPFAPPHKSYHAMDGWYHVSGLIFWLTGIQCEGHKDVDQDLDLTSRSMKLHMEALLDLYQTPEEFEAKIDCLRRLHQGGQITLDELKTKRASLQALGQESSLQAAFHLLMGDRK